MRYATGNVEQGVLVEATMSSTKRPPDLAQEWDKDQQEQYLILKAFMSSFHHFFGDFDTCFETVDDPRQAELITYPLEALFFAGVMLFFCRLGARRQLAHMFRENGPSEAKFQALFGTDTCPHGDTLNVVFARLDPEQMQGVVTSLVRTLIRKKVLDRYRLLGRYFVIAVDGTGRLTFPERHCPHCLTVTRQGKTTYYHPVLEAKLVLPNGFAFSILTEFIENPGENPSKQDCELKAFYRLAARLKAEFPRLPICLSLDALFAGGPTMSLCEQYNWQYMIVHKEGDIPFIHQEFESLLPLTPENHFTFFTGPQSKTRQEYRWINDISYTDSQKKKHQVAVLECVEDEPDPKQPGQTKSTRFRWITNFTLKDSQVPELANQGGRIRWKIENEGFNVQKNGGFDLEHAYTTHPVAAKIFYFLLQIAHLLAQLIEKGSLFRIAFPKGVGSAKNIAFRLLEAWRNLRLSADCLHNMLNIRLQIRFVPP
jgi:hypothetical protein